MDLKQLEYFVTVINEGTISSAARKLNLSQPPLSAQNIPIVLNPCETSNYIFDIM